MKLGILLTTSPQNENTHTVIELAKAARAMGHEVSIFLMEDGVYNVRDKKFAALSDAGVKIALCALNTEDRGVEKVDCALFGSQYDHASIAHDSDRFVSFG